MKYIWQREDFPKYTYDPEPLAPVTEQCLVLLGEVRGLISLLDKGAQEDLALSRLSTEGALSSRIEGVTISPDELRSSLERQLGLAGETTHPQSRYVEGVARLMILSLSDMGGPITAERLHDWHRALMEDRRDIHPGQWRSSPLPMQIVSGRIIGREEVHYEAPPSSRLDEMMGDFLSFCNSVTVESVSEAIRHSGICHLYFETLHPYEDGNGRVGRALAHHILARGLGQDIPISLSHAIEMDRATYYARLKEASVGTMDVTPWLLYWTETVRLALEETISRIAFLRRRRDFIRRMSEHPLSERQIKVLHRMLEAEPEGFAGGMTPRKYASLTRTSKATATRDLAKLSEWGLLIPEGAGRSTAYRLVFGE